MIEDREYLLNLYYIYESLLTNTEQYTFKNYYEEDLSLSEIAINRNISKSSVGKTLNSAENKLKEYENNLKIYNIYQELNNLLNINDLNKIKDKIKKIIDEQD